MALTVTNVNSLSLLNILNRTSTAQSDTLTKLSTGFRINSGKDDPAGLLAIRGLETSLTATNAAIENNQRTDSILKTADSALGEVAKLLGQIQSLAQKSTNAGALSSAEIAANQSQIDDAIAAIDRIIGTTEFNGRKLLDGSLAVDVDGATSATQDIQVFSRNTKNGEVSLTISREVEAELASAVLASGASFALSGSAQFQISGKTGSRVVEFASGSSLADIRDTINDFKAATGVSASLVSVGGSSQLVLNSTDYGSQAFVRATRVSEDAVNAADSAEDDGLDAVVTINGQKAAVDGLFVSFNNNGLSLSFNISKTFNEDGGTASFTVTEDGGATFQLGADSSTRATIGVDGLFSQRLGSSTNGYLTSLRSGEGNDLLSDPGKAAQIAADAARQIAQVQGRLGGFQKFQVGTALAQQNTAKESLTGALSTIRDVDYASETAELNRQNVLLQSALSLIGVANQQSSQILSLLR